MVQFFKPFINVDAEKLKVNRYPFLQSREDMHQHHGIHPAADADQQMIALLVIG